MLLLNFWSSLNGTFCAGQEVCQFCWHSRGFGKTSFLQGSSRKISQSCNPCERTLCMYQGTCQHLLPVKRKGRVFTFWMCRDAANRWGGQGEVERGIWRKYGDRQWGGSPPLSYRYCSCPTQTSMFVPHGTAFSSALQAAMWQTQEISSLPSLHASRVSFWGVLSTHGATLALS